MGQELAALPCPPPPARGFLTVWGFCRLPCIVSHAHAPAPQQQQHRLLLQLLLNPTHPPPTREVLATSSLVDLHVHNPRVMDVCLSPFGF